MNRSLIKSTARSLAALALGATLALGAQAGTDVTSGPALTRQEVRDALAQARATNRLTPSGEIGDTTEVLAQREVFNALQRQVMAEAVERAAAERASTLAAPEATGEPVVLTIGELFELMDHIAAQGGTAVMLIEVAPQE